jgi:hypothetical protein
MKANTPLVIALVLWLLVWATNAFAVLRSPYPRKAEAPDQIVIVTDGHVGPVVRITSKPK